MAGVPHSVKTQTLVPKAVSYFPPWSLHFKDGAPPARKGHQMTTLINSSTLLIKAMG